MNHTNAEDLIFGTITYRAEQSYRSRLGSIESWSRTPDRRARTQPGWARSPGALAYWENRVDRHHELDEEERERRAVEARREYFRWLALRNAELTRVRRNGYHEDDGPDEAA